MASADAIFKLDEHGAAQRSRQQVQVYKKNIILVVQNGEEICDGGSVVGVTRVKGAYVEGLNKTKINDDHTARQV